MIAHISRNSPARLIGVESYHGFGDCCFNTPFIKAISTLSNGKVGVAVKGQCADAFQNLPWVDEIIPIKSMGDGEAALKRLGYKRTYQITQNMWFNIFKEKDQSHSLIDTPSLVAAALNLPEFDRRPIYIPTAKELDFPRPTRPVIAMETIYTSQQSWATEEDFELIRSKYRQTHDIIELSNHDVPRRNLIPQLRDAEPFFSVGSGFFCASLGLSDDLKPRQIVCMWKDEIYRYERRLAELGWHDNIVWIHNRPELERYLCEK